MSTSTTRSPDDAIRRLRSELAELYGADDAAEVEALVADVRRRAGASPRRGDPPRTWTERDAVLITYGDQIQSPGEAPLRTLHGFLRDRLSGLVSAVHLLAISPWSSDDGFAVVDYSQVDPALGTWDDVSGIAADFELMLDVVLNHASSRNPWLAGFLADDPEFARHFIEVPPGTDLSAVVRPRATPLLTHFEGPAGERLLWTTFSRDQVDLNYRNPRVFRRMVEVMLDDIDHGASFLRLDAVGYAWKEPGTTSLNLPRTHRLVRAIRAAVDATAPGTAIVTETNVAQQENIAYFGDGEPEAQVVYQFSLPPLVLHALLFGTADRLASWISSLPSPPPGCAFLNMVATHDGIGLMPAEDLLSETEIADTVEQVVAHGARVSMRDTPSGHRPYEVNSTLFDALSDPYADEPEPLRVARHLAANAIMLTLSGIPGIYVHSLFGSPNDHAAVKETRVARRINRRRFRAEELDAALADSKSRAARVFSGVAALLRARASHPAFRPDSPQRVLDAPPGVLAVERGSDETGRVLCLVNLTAEPRTVDGFGPGVDLVSRAEVEAAVGTSLRLRPYDVLWLADPAGSQPAAANR